MAEGERHRVEMVAARIGVEQASGKSLPRFASWIAVTVNSGGGELQGRRCRSCAYDVRPCGAWATGERAERAVRIRGERPVGVVGEGAGEATDGEHQALPVACRHNQHDSVRNAGCVKRTAVHTGYGDRVRPRSPVQLEAANVVAVDAVTGVRADRVVVKRR